MLTTQTHSKIPISSNPLNISLSFSRPADEENMSAGNAPPTMPCEVGKPKIHILPHLQPNPPKLSESKSSARDSNVIKTPSIFSLMELPTEIRLKILYFLLLTAEENIKIHCTQKGASIQSDGPDFERPSVSILQSCKRINEEGTPILYGQHTFTIHLRELVVVSSACAIPLTAAVPFGPQDGELSCFTSAFFLRPLRWSTAACIHTMHFKSGKTYTSNIPRPSGPAFSCTAAELLSQYTAPHFAYAPISSNKNITLSMSNYISTRVMYVELNAFQKEMEFLMRPSEDYLAALADDPAT